MLKHDIENYFRQFRKPLSICLQWNITYTDLVIYNYLWFDQLNVCAIYGILSDK